MRRSETITEFNKEESWKIFDSIYRKYDILNRILSFGLDTHWRKKITGLTKSKSDIRLIDFASGTGDVIISFMKITNNLEYACGTDLSEKMLISGKEKIDHLNLDRNFDMLRSDAVNTPIKNSSFNVATIAFGIRNMPDPGKVLSEMKRVLVKGGEIFVLEFSLPSNRIIKKLHIAYLRTFIPFIGKVISGNFGAYKYLDKTIESFPYGEKFAKLLMESGFSECLYKSLAFGAVTLYRGVKQ